MSLGGTKMSALKNVLGQRMQTSRQLDAGRPAGTRHQLTIDELREVVDDTAAHQWRRKNRIGRSKRDQVRLRVILAKRTTRLARTVVWLLGGIMMAAS